MCDFGFIGSNRHDPDELIRAAGLRPLPDYKNT